MPVEVRTCGACAGTGSDMAGYVGGRIGPCGRCKGVGRVEVPLPGFAHCDACDIDFRADASLTCPKCKGETVSWQVPTAAGAIRERVSIDETEEK